MGFLRLACICEETCQCVWPPNASLYASSTCTHLGLLAGPFDQGLNPCNRKCLVNFISNGTVVTFNTYEATYI